LNYRGIIFTTLVGILGYSILLFKIPRNEFASIITLIGVEFYIYYFILKNCTKNNYPGIVAIILFHGIAFLAHPNFSDDYYRFLWDGLLNNSGISPFEYIPSDFITNHPHGRIYDELYIKLNSKEYYSVYPPMKQVLFSLAATAKTVQGGLFNLKLIIVVGNVFLFFMLKKLAAILKLNPLLPFYVLLNPLVIIETTGNLHFEAITVSLFLYGYILMHKKRFMASGIFLGTSILMKLLPVLFLPFLLRPLHLHQRSGILIGIAILSLLATPFYPSLDTIGHMLNSLNLYFQTFEFNSSLFNFINLPLSVVLGYDATKFAGPICLILFLSFYIYSNFRFERNNSFFLFYLLTLVYYLFASTVHPWYFIYVLIIGMLAEAKSSLVIGFSILISYNFYAFGHGFWNNILNCTEYGLMLYFFIRYDYQRLKSIFIRRKSRRKTETA